MNDGPEWFAPKRYGYGAGWPISWQGRLLTIGYAAVAIGLGFTIGDRPPLLIAALAPITIFVVVIAARTTRGGWRWRWGEKE